MSGFREHIAVLPDTARRLFHIKVRGRKHSMDEVICMMLDAHDAQPGVVPSTQDIQEQSKGKRKHLTKER